MEGKEGFKAFGWLTEKSYGMKLFTLFIFCETYPKSGGSWGEERKGREGCQGRVQRKRKAYKYKGERNRFQQAQPNWDLASKSDAYFLLPFVI